MSSARRARGAAPAAVLLMGAALLGAGGLAPAAAQPVQRATLQEQPFPGGPNHTVLMRVIVAKGAEVAAHTHPGLEMAYVVDGQALVKIAGRPDQTLKTGDSFAVPMGTVHSVRNAGEGPLTLVSTYVVDKAKPITTPARSK